MSDLHFYINPGSPVVQKTSAVVPVTTTGSYGEIQPKPAIVELDLVYLDGAHDHRRTIRAILQRVPTNADIIVVGKVSARTPDTCDQTNLSASLVIGGETPVVLQPNSISFDAANIPVYDEPSSTEASWFDFEITWNPGGGFPTGRATITVELIFVSTGIADTATLNFRIIE